MRQMLEEGEKLRANPDLDPVRKGRVLAQFAREALYAIERDSRSAVDTRLQAIADVWQMLEEERKTLRANPDLDPVRRARALAEFMREARRAIEVHKRLVAEIHRGFNLAAVLEEALAEAKPEIERRKQRYLRDQRDAERAEMSTDEPDGRAPKPS